MPESLLVWSRSLPHQRRLPVSGRNCRRISSRLSHIYSRYAPGLKQRQVQGILSWSRAILVLFILLCHSSWRSAACPSMPRPGERRWSACWMMAQSNCRIPSAMSASENMVFEGGGLMQSSVIMVDLMKNIPYFDVRTAFLGGKNCSFKKQISRC